MVHARMSVLIALAVLGCKRDRQSEPVSNTPKTAPAADAAAASDAGRATSVAELTWYRAAIRAASGVESPFLLGVPPAGTPGQAVIRVGGHDVRSEATFDGKALRVSFTVHQTAIDATVGPDGTLAGTFTTSWRAWGEAKLPLTGTRVAAPVIGALATLTSAGTPGSAGSAGSAGAAALDLGEPRTVWRLAMTESETAKLVIEQTAPGEYAGLMFLDTGNLLYLAGTGRADALVLAGFDGTSGYRLELAFGPDRTRAKGDFYGGHRLDWHEQVTATRGPDFVLAAKPKASAPDVKIELPESPALAGLPRAPMIVELAGSWCSTCRNAAPFLVELYREYKPRGLEMVTLLYEFTDDAAIDAQQAQRFKEDYGVTWPIVPVRGGTDVFAEILPPGLEGIDPSGFPITLFVAADRTLVAVHAGFPAADAPDEFRRVSADFREKIERLLAAPK